MANKNIINRIFELPVSVLQPILNDHIPKFVKAYDRNQNELMDKLFELPQDILQTILDIYAAELLQANKLSNFDFVEKLSTLPIEILKSIINNHAKLIFESTDSSYKIVGKLLVLPAETLHTTLNDNSVGELLSRYAKTENSNIKALLHKYFDNNYVNPNARKIIDNYNYNTAQDMAILEFSPSAITYMDDPKNLHPIISKLLSKTYFHTKEEHAQKKEFIHMWNLGLEKIISVSPTIAKILELSTNTANEIFIINEPFLPGESCISGTCDGKLQIRVAAGRGIDKALGTLVHESTHKIIQMTHDNDMLPFEKNGNFTDMANAVEVELEHAQMLHLQSVQANVAAEDSWLNSLIGSYPEEKIAVEILPHFTAQITKSILNNNNKDSVSLDFATIMWKYLHSQLPTNLGTEELPKSSYHAIDLLDNQNELVIIAKEILSNENPNHKWLDSEAGKLAFKSLTFTEKDTYFTKLFELPSEELSQILPTHLVSLIKYCGNYSPILVSLIAGLSPEVINPVIKTHATEILESFTNNDQWGIQSHIFQMSSEEIKEIIESDSPKFLELCGSYTLTILSKLFELPPSQLALLLAKHGDYLSQISGDMFKDVNANGQSDLKIYAYYDSIELPEDCLAYYNTVDSVAVGEHYDGNVL